MRPEGQGALSCFCLTRDAIIPYTYGNSVQLIRLEAVTSPLARRTVSVLLPAPLVATLHEARALACVKTEQGIFMSGAWVGGNIGPTRGGSFPLALLEKGNEVANLDDGEESTAGLVGFCRLLLDGKKG